MHYSHPGHCSSSHSRRDIWTWSIIKVLSKFWNISLVLKLEGAAVADPDELGVGGGAAAVHGAAPDHHQLARVPVHAAQLDAGGAGEQAVPAIKNDRRWLFSVCLKFL